MVRLKHLILSLFCLLVCCTVLSVRADAAESRPDITYPLLHSVVDQRDVAGAGFRFQLKSFPAGLTTVSLRRGATLVWKKQFDLRSSFEILVLTGPKTLSSGSYSLTCSQGTLSRSVAFRIGDVREPEVTWAEVRQKILDTVFRGETLVTWSPYRTVKEPDMGMSAVLAELDALAAFSRDYWTYGDGYVQLHLTLEQRELLAQMHLVRTETRNALLTIMDEPIHYTREQMLLNIQRYLSTIGTYDASQPLGAYPKAQHSGWSMLTTGHGVCSSFASLGYEMVLACDIPVRMKVARTKDGTSAHAWLMVQMEDGNWYNLDFTWNNTDVQNPVGEDELVRLDSFLVSDTAYARTFVWDEGTYPVAASDYPLSLSRSAYFSTGYRFHSLGESGLYTRLVKVGAANSGWAAGTTDNQNTMEGPGEKPSYWGPGEEPSYWEPVAGPGVEPAYW